MKQLPSGAKALGAVLLFTVLYGTAQVLLLLDKASGSNKGLG